MTDKKPLTFCVDWMRGRAERTPMPASRATMESIVDYLEELESLKETLDMYGGWDGINAVYQKLEDLKTTDPKADVQTAACTGQNCPMQASTVDPANCACAETCRWATRPRTNGDVIRAMSDEGLVKLLVRKAKPWCAGLRCKEDYDCRTCIDRWLKREAT